MSFRVGCGGGWEQGKLCAVADVLPASHIGAGSSPTAPLLTQLSTWESSRGQIKDLGP